MTTTVPRPSTARPRVALRDRVLKLAELVTTPLLPTDYLDLIDPLRSGADLRGRIEAVLPETRDAATVVLRPGRGWQGHTPGQYIRIGIDVDGVRQWRAYSLTHGPRADRRIAVTVKAVPDGMVSHHLVHRTEPGTMVHLEQAAGEFVLPVGPDSDDPDVWARELVESGAEVVFFCAAPGLCSSAARASGAASRARRARRAGRRR